MATILNEVMEAVITAFPGQVSVGGDFAISFYADLGWRGCTSIVFFAHSNVKLYQFIHRKLPAWRCITIVNGDVFTDGEQSIIIDNTHYDPDLFQISPDGRFMIWTPEACAVFAIKQNISSSVHNLYNLVTSVPINYTQIAPHFVMIRDFANEWLNLVTTTALDPAIVDTLKAFVTPAINNISGSYYLSWNPNTLEWEQCDPMVNELDTLVEEEYCDY